MLTETFNQRGAKISGNRAADEAGDMEERLNQVLLAGIQLPGHLVTGVRSDATQVRELIAGPVFEPCYQGRSLFPGLGDHEAFQVAIRANGVQGNGNAAAINGRRQDAHASKGFGTEDFHNGGRCRAWLQELIQSTTPGATDQQPANNSVGGAEDSLAFV